MNESENKMIYFPIILDTYIWKGKNSFELPAEILEALQLSKMDVEYRYHEIEEEYDDLGSLANGLAFNILDVVFGEQEDSKMMNLYVVHLTNKIMKVYLTYEKLQNAVRISKGFTEGEYPCFQIIWYKAIMYEVNKEVGDFYARQLIEKAKAKLEAKEYDELNHILHRALEFSPDTQNEINQLFD